MAIDRRSQNRVAWRKVVSIVVTYLLFLLLLGIVLVPLVWIIGLSFKTVGEIFTVNRFFPETITLDNYRHILTATRFPRSILNSTIVAGLSAILGIIVAVPAAYGCSRWEFPSKTPFMIALLGLQLIPGATVMLPYYQMASALGLLNTHIGLIIIFGAMRIPLSLWVLKGFFDSIPRSLEEAALIDGAGRLQSVTKVFLPLALPGLAAIMFINLLNGWNSFLLPLIINTDRNMELAIVTLTSYQHAPEGAVYLNYMAAGGIVVAGAMVILYVILQKGFIAGLTAGSVKG